ncbi:unnamed protein product [Ixodes pacificus]
MVVGAEAYSQTVDGCDLCSSCDGNNWLVAGDLDLLHPHAFVALSEPCTQTFGRCLQRILTFSSFVFTRCSAVFPKACVVHYG